MLSPTRKTLLVPSRMSRGRVFELRKKTPLLKNTRSGAVGCPVQGYV